MKHFFLFAVALLFTLSANAQGIKFRRLLEADGLSVMTTKLEVFPWGEKKIEYALQYVVAPVEDMHQGYYLNVYLDVDNQSQYIPKRGKLLIRTAKENVISLTDVGTEEYREYNPEYNLPQNVSRSTSFYDEFYKRVRYTIQGKYPISKEELQMLMDEGVIKIRIETTGGSVECSYKVDPNRQNKTAEVITKLHNTLISNIDPYYGLE